MFLCNAEALKYICIHIPGTIIAMRKRFFRGTPANFCKSKKCIIFNVDCLGSEKSKFDMILIRHSPFNMKIFYGQYKHFE